MKLNPIASLSMVIICLGIGCPDLDCFGQEKAEPLPKSLHNRLQKKLDNIVAEQGVPGATLSVVLADGTLIDLASGVEDPDTNAKLAVGAKMFCGSTGKTFVSAVALQLITDGKLKLDNLASNYFTSEADQKWFAKLPNSKTMTVRSLMNHTSGLPRYIFQKAFMDDLKANPMRDRTPIESLSLLEGVDPIHEVGEGWGYSDTNYLILGLIIERIAGKPYFDVARERLLTPLKLENTQPTTQARLEGLVQGHIGSVNFLGLPKKTVVDGSYAINPNFEWCGGGFVTNTKDLARWLHALHTGEVLTESMRKQLVAPVGFRSGKPDKQGYGLGSFVWQSEQGPIYGHAGIMPGYLTQIEFSPKQKVAVALQTNSDEGMGQGMHQRVQEVFELVAESSN